MEAKEALTGLSGPVGDTTTLTTQFSTLSVSEESSQAAGEHGLSSLYQVFILAGFGHGLYPLTEEDSIPKALLPIANTPLIYFPLEWCSKAGFSDVTIVCHTEALEQISAYTSSLSLDITTKVIAKSRVEDNLGSAEALGLLKDTITRDFIVLACDSYTTLPPQDLLSFQISKNSSATALFFDGSQNQDLVNLKLKENDSSLYTCYEQSSHRLLFMKSALDVHKSLDLRTSLLWRYPRINISTALQDAHIYIFKKWVIDLIARNENISSLRTDLLPVLAKMQWQSNLRKREGIDQILPFADHPVVTSDDTLPQNLKTESPVSVSLLIAPATAYTVRANSIPTYLVLNRHVALQAPDPRKHPTSKAGAKTSVGQDSVVAENCTLGERVQIRKSVVSRGVSIGSRSSVRACVIMDGVTIGENASLEGCVVSRGAKVGDKVKLVDCMVAAGYVVEEGLKLSKQNLVQLDDFEDDDEDVEEESEEDDE